VPDGLAGEAIPLEARIAAVADAFDAMTSGRPYRAGGFTVNDAVTELKHYRGTQFDPDVVDAFVAAIESGAIEVAEARPSLARLRERAG
jgi:HD-GYP domain-containing protein (c-di-GMP phosphodiesterase class II)